MEPAHAVEGQTAAQQSHENVENGQTNFHKGETWENKTTLIKWAWPELKWLNTRSSLGRYQHGDEYLD
jgi:hypothetical protein